MAALAAPERPEPDTVLIRLDIRKDLGDDRSSAFRAYHSYCISQIKTRGCGSVIVLLGGGPGQWRAALPRQVQ